MKSRLLSPLYLAALLITLPLLWMTSPAVRAEIRRFAPKVQRRGFLLVIRLLARYGARELGWMIVAFAAVPATIVTGALGLGVATVVAALAGFLGFALIPVFMPMPSHEMDDALATGRRHV